MPRFKQVIGFLALFVFCLAVLSGCDSSALPVPSPTPSSSPAQPTSTTAPAVASSFTAEPTESPAESTSEPSEPSEEADTASYSELHLGLTSPDVIPFQQRLMDLGYLVKEGPGQYYDAETQQAVALFQAASGIDPTGIADAATQRALFSEAAPPYVPAASSVEADPAQEGISVPVLPLSGIRIGLDPGHQASGNSDPEPVAPGSSETKPKVSSGTSGVASGTDEYIVNLQVGLKLKALLEAQGAEVLMTRETDDVDISNAQRAQMMNEAGVDLVVRLHCNGDTDTSRQGAFVLIPAGEYTTSIQDVSRQAAESVLSSFVAATGAVNLGLSERSDQTGFNWSTVPVINIEMGHLSNPEEDLLLTSDAYQDQCAFGIMAGIVDYFS